MGVKVVETSLRDGHQSLFATRMTTDEVLLALPDPSFTVVMLQKPTTSLDK